jgi:integrase
MLHARQMVKRDVGPAAAPTATWQTRTGARSARPRNGKARTISLPRWLRDMLAEHRHRPLPAQAPEHTVFHTASGKAAYPTVFMRGVFGPAEAALPAETQGLRFHDLRHTRARRC